MSPSSPSFGRRGFTLVELLISLVIGALIISVVLQFVSGQARLTTMQSGRQEVQQNARGALEMVSSDLRGAIAAGVEVGDADAIEVMLPRRWGIVCAQGVGFTVVVFPDIPAQPTPSGAGAGLLFQQPGANVWLPALPTRATVTGTIPVDVDPTCAGLSTSGTVMALRLNGANHPAVAVGSTAALYQRVRYDVRELRGQKWLYRSNGMDAGGFSMQPLAGPLDGDNGVSFTYFTGTPPDSLDDPPGAGAPAAGLSQVRLRVRMKSLQGSSPQVEFDSATVQIRNDN
ncbi:MAG TPA: prepilin-type N-terminal cleavage/methylation domain-containing protein [Longimicrobium sp.]|nr:prepilin-type N-terminal cleavage/methylation domain-containing protein [Longimicrobium sp.]